MSRVYRPMDSARCWFIVNLRRWHLEELTEAWLAGTVEPGSSLRKVQKGEDTPGILTDCTDGRRRGGVRPAMRRTIGGGARSALGKCRRGKVELDGAHCCKMNDRGVGAFI
jgi:hypothetical protein